MINPTIKQNGIKDKIYNIRGRQVMIDHDLAEMYQVETKVLNQAVKRNIDRFPKEFRFQLTDKEYTNLRSQIVTSSLVSQNAIPSQHGGKRYLPYTFTEQGVSMLSAVLRSETAIMISIQIMNAFVEMRKLIATNTPLFQKVHEIEIKQQNYQIKSDKKFEQLFKALEDGDIKPKQGIFFDGQVFDAYTFVSNIIRSAKTSIILIDNYIDDTVLKLLTKRKKSVNITIYSKTISKLLKQDIEKYNRQYEPIYIKILKTSHDRFLIIDKKTIYHFGASLKDLGKKWVAFSKMKMEAFEIVERL